MATYQVRLVQTVYEETSVTVEANNQEEAETKALDLAYADNGPTWNFMESVGDAEVISTEKLQPPIGFTTQETFNPRRDNAP